MSVFFAGAISIMSMLFTMFVFFSWRATDKKKPAKQRIKEVLVESMKMVIMIVVSMTITSVVFQMAIHFLIK